MKCDNPTQCDDRLLMGLLEDTLSGPRSNTVTRHVGSCHHCQQRLQQLAADPASWQEISAALSPSTQLRGGSVVIVQDSELGHDMPVQADRIAVDFLDAPSHPELLGRLGRYDIECVIGAGGMGIVFKAFDTELHRPVAVKVLAPHLAHSGAARQRFAREAQSAAAVVHHNVVPIHNVDVAGKLPFLVMSFVSGESLQSRVDRTGPLGIREVLRIALQTAKGLAAAHEQGLVHRDVKPGNILLENDVDRVLISDFGLARAADDACATRSGLIVGTPHYMSPEQARGNALDPRSDLFSLGSVLYFMCTGRPPFRAEGAMAVLNRICHDTHRPVDEVNDHVPAGLADLIDGLLQKDAGKRPEDAQAVERELAALAQHDRHAVRRRPAHRTFWRWCAAASASLLTVLAILAVLFHVDRFSADSSAPAATVGDQAAASSARERQELSAAGQDRPTVASNDSTNIDVRRATATAFVPNAATGPTGPADPTSSLENENPLDLDWGDPQLLRELAEIDAELKHLEITRPPAAAPAPFTANDLELEILRCGMDAVEAGISELAWPHTHVE